MEYPEQYKLIEESDYIEYSTMTMTGNITLFLLRIDQMHQHDISGELFNLYWKEPESFASLAEAIYKMERFMDEVNCPQTTSELRDIYLSEDGSRSRKRRSSIQRLSDLQQYWRSALFSQLEERHAVVFIRVRYRMNHSWQGTALWRGRDGLKKEVHFRSVLELLQILQSAVIATDYEKLEQKGIGQTKLEKAENA